MQRAWWSILVAAVVFGCNGSKTTSTGAGGGNPPAAVLLIAADRNGDLYSVDPTTGADTLLLNTFTDDGMGGTTDVGVISSMVYVPSLGRLLAGTGGKATCPACALDIDVTTGQATVLQDNSMVTSGIAGMAIHTTDDTVFAAAGDGDNLLRVNPATGVATGAGSFGTGTGSGNALTFAKNGALVLAADTTLFFVSTVTAQATPVADMTFTGFPAFSGGSVSIVSLATANDGTLFGIVQDGGGTGGGMAGAPTYLATVDTTTGEITFVGQFTHHLDGLAFVPASLFP